MRNLVFIFTCLSIFIDCRGQKIQSTWMENKITVDGIIEDWKDIPRIYEEDLKIMLSVSNDHDNLNLMYCFNDPALARMIAMRGVTVWLNDEAKNEKNFGIAFKNDLMDQLKEMNREQFRNRDEQLPGGKNLRELLKSGCFTVELKDTLSGLLMDELPGVEASVDQIEGLYCFEMRVPICEIKKSRTMLQIPENNQMKIGIEIPEAKRIMPERNREGTGMRGGGRDGGRGGMRGGGMGSRGGARPDMSAKEIWTTVILVEHLN